MMRLLLMVSLALSFMVLISWKPQYQGIPKAVMDRGRKIYEQSCLTCHMANAMGVPRMSPSLIRSKYVLGSKTKLIRIVLNGSEEFADSEDRNYRNPMAPLDNLTDQQISDVLTYLRNSFTNRASAITPGDVKYVRAGNK